MALLNDIKRMQSEGKTEQEIISILKQQGVSAREIVDALSQSKIKEAVAGEPEPPTPYAASPPSSQEPIMPMPGTDIIPKQAEEMQSISPATPAEQAMQYPSPQPAQPQPLQATYPSYPEYQQYPQYAQAPAISADTITEISEQVVSEKLSPLRKDIEKVIDMKTTMESKLEYLDERLKRIERIIDRLNLSIMQKVGEYMTNIEDIKKELIETQKSFKALTPPLETKEKQKKQE
ncbi:MAG: hypothetical protein QXS38_00215 [Candidatus Pacearchaeota archaeon]